MRLHISEHLGYIISFSGYCRLLSDFRCWQGRGYISLTHLLGWTPKLRTTKFDIKQLETSLDGVVQNVGLFQHQRRIQDFNFRGGSGGLRGCRAGSGPLWATDWCRHGRPTPDRL